MSNPHILVVGGAGYIGSHMVDLLLAEKFQVTVLDDLSSGHRQAVGSAELVVGDMADTALLQEIFRRQSISAVMHFAAFMCVEESVRDPAAYYRNNVGKTLILLDALRTAGVRDLIFSSSAAVFGIPEHIPVTGTHRQQPINPYGRSKQMVEHILADYVTAYGLRCAVLRYFNAAGAAPDGRLGELHEPETHLIPLALQTAAGKRDTFYIFGSDYDTPDGTCRRDFIHICDLARAHLLTLNRLRRNDTPDYLAYNLGNGTGYTVRQVVDTVREVSGIDFPVMTAPRRAGDPAALVADATDAITALDWHIQYPSLKEIIQHAWQWEQNRCFNPR